MTIPKIIHQMWLDKEIDDNEIVPNKYREHVRTFKINNPEFTYILWNNNKVKQLFNHPEIIIYKNYFDNASDHIIKCDFARYAIMYLYGGIYSDLDFYCNKNLSLLLKRPLLLVYEPYTHTEENDGIDRRLFNGFIGSTSGQQFWLDFMAYIIKNHNNSLTAHFNTGPIAFAKFIRDNKKYNNNNNPTWYINTCDVLPVLAPWKKKDTRDASCNKNNAHAYTLWREGSGYGKLHLNGFSNILHNNIRYYILLLIGMVIVILSIRYLFIKRNS